MKVHVLLACAAILFNQSAFSMIRVIVESVSNLTNQSLTITRGTKEVVLEPNKTYQNAFVYDLDEDQYGTLRFKNDYLEAQFEAGLELETGGRHALFIANLASIIDVNKSKVIIAQERDYGNAQHLIAQYEQWVFYIKIVLSGAQFENSQVSIKREILERR